MKYTLSDDARKGYVTKIAGAGLTILLKMIHVPDSAAEKAGDNFSEFLAGVEPEKKPDDFKKHWNDALDRMWIRMERDFDLPWEFWEPLKRYLFRSPETLKKLIESPNPSGELSTEIQNYYKGSPNIDISTLPTNLVDALLIILDEEIRNDISLNNSFYVQTQNRQVEQLAERFDKYIDMQVSMNSEVGLCQNLINAFYDDVIAKMTSINYESGELFGYEPLNDVYITPYIYINEERGKISVFEYLEQVCTKKTGAKTIVLYGEPGQGKTSLCWKAAYEFKVNGWLKQQFDNVLRFSLNASSFNIEDDIPLYNYHELETYLKFNGCSIPLENCKKSLIFLDGFDELYDNVISKPLQNFSLEYFLRKILFPALPKCTGSYFIITSRRMCIEHELKNNRIAGIDAYGICRMDTVDQDLWIKSYGEILKKREIHSNETIKTRNYWDYIEKLKTFRQDERIKDLLEIPILFRMVINCRFLPTRNDGNYSRASIYDMLFHETMIRHGGDEYSTKISMEQLAFAIYFDNEDSANIDDIDTHFITAVENKHKISKLIKNGSLPSWLYSYYTMYSKGKRRIMFLHRSFYQYFLACYIYRFIKSSNENTLKSTDLVFFGRRRIGSDVFEYLSQLLDKNDEECLRNNAKAILKILINTDSVLHVDTKLTDKIDVAVLDQAGNVFCNIISALSVLGILPKEALNTSINVSDHYRMPLLQCLKRFSSHGIMLNNVDVNGEISNSGPFFVNASIIGVNFSDSDYSGSIFKGSILENDVFQNTVLKGALFSDTKIKKTDFRGAVLRGASFSDVVFDDDNLIDVDCSGASFSDVVFRCNTIINKAKFRVSTLSKVIFEGSEYEDMDFSGSTLSNVIFGTPEDECSEYHNMDFSGATLTSVLVHGMN